MTKGLETACDGDELPLCAVCADTHAQALDPEQGWVCEPCMELLADVDDLLAAYQIGEMLGGGEE